MCYSVNCSYVDEKTTTREDNGGSDGVIDAENNAMSTQTETEEDNDNAAEAAVSVEMKMMNSSNSAAEGAAICCMAPNEDDEVGSRNPVTNAKVQSVKLI